MLYDGLSESTIENCISTLGALRRALDVRGRLDAFDAEAIRKAMTRVDIELTFVRQAQIDATKREAEAFQAAIARADALALPALQIAAE